jgi:hypothetical protein
VSFTRTAVVVFGYRITYWSWKINVLCHSYFVFFSAFMTTFLLISPSSCWGMFVYCILECLFP